MTLRLFDTYTRSVRDFEPLQADHVGLYACGPTVYDYFHLNSLEWHVDGTGEGRLLLCLRNVDTVAEVDAATRAAIAERIAKGD